MIIETAVVKSITGDQLTVQCESHSACNHCHASAECGTGTIAKAFPQRSHQFVVTGTAQVSVGDKIDVGLREKNIITSAMLVYLLPLFTMLTSIVLAQLLTTFLQYDNELSVILSAFTGVFLGFKLTKVFSANYEQRFDFKPKMVGVVSQAEIIGQWRPD